MRSSVSWTGTLLWCDTNQGTPSQAGLYQNTCDPVTDCKAGHHPSLHPKTQLVLGSMG